MKIGIDASRLNLKEKTGTEWYSYYIIKNLLNIDQENQYFLFSQEKLPNEFLKYNQVQNIVLSWPFKKFWTIFRLSLALNKYSLDLFFSPAHNLPITKVKKVITWHDLAYEYFPEYYSKLQLWSLKMGAKSLVSADLIISPSLNTKYDLIKFYKIKENKIFVIPHGLDFKKYNNISLDDNILNKYQIKNDYILYIGRLESKKNVINLIRAYFKLRDNKLNYHLVLIGKKGRGFKKIKNEIKNSIYGKDIHLLGWLPEIDKIKFLKRSKLFCFLSNYEGFGMPILEAILCKVPILISNIDVFKEFAIDDYCFVKNEISDISSKMRDLTSNQKLRTKLIEKNLNLVQKFTWQRSAKLTKEVFEKIGRI